MTTKLPIAETFYTIQGEGRTVGKPAVFLRLGGCNLLCGDPDNPEAPQEELEKSEDATWLCDTIETWKNPDAMTVEEIFDIWNGMEESVDIIEGLMEGDIHLIITGGEPMLHQDKLCDLMDGLGRNSVIEVETNGTVEPNKWFDSYIDYYNVSQKLSNSGMDEERRINEDAIQEFVDRDRAMFKFVVSREEDVEEIWSLQRRFDIPSNQIMLMPAGYTRDDLDNTYQAVAELCKQEGFRFTPRLHVQIWGKATGV